MTVHNYNPNIQDEAEAGGCCMSKASLYHIGCTKPVRIATNLLQGKKKMELLSLYI